jgi:hypothetical protein
MCAINPMVKGDMIVFQCNSPLKSDWKIPLPPKGFEENTILIVWIGVSSKRIAAFYGGFAGDFDKPDFFNEKTGIEASEIGYQFPWPWVDGYKPTLDDWRKLGFAICYE